MNKKKYITQVFMTLLMSLFVCTTAEAEVIDNTHNNSNENNTYGQSYLLENNSTLHFKITNKGGENKYENPIVLFSSLQVDKESIYDYNFVNYAYVRSDSSAIGNGADMCEAGTPITYESTCDDWNTFIDTMRYADINATISKTNKDIELKYEVKGKNNKEFVYKASFSNDGINENVYVTFTGDNNVFNVEILETVKSIAMSNDKENYINKGDAIELYSEYNKEDIENISEANKTLVNTKAISSTYKTNNNKTIDSQKSDTLSSKRIPITIIVYTSSCLILYICKRTLKKVRI